MPQKRMNAGAFTFLEQEEEKLPSFRIIGILYNFSYDIFRFISFQRVSKLVNNGFRIYTDAGTIRIVFLKIGHIFSFYAKGIYYMDIFIAKYFSVQENFLVLFFICTEF